MNEAINAPAIRAPFSAYSHGMAVAPGARLLFCSGQLGIDAADTVPPDAKTQTELCFANIEAVLQAGGMQLSDIVQLRAFVTDRAHLQAYMEVRNRLFADPLAPSTLMVVSGFSRPEFLVEVEAVAAGPPNSFRSDQA